MASKTSFVYGIGFPAFVPEWKLSEFVIKHGSTIVTKLKDEREIKLLEECRSGKIEGIKESFCDICCNVTGHSGIYAIIANIMSAETDIQFQYEPGGEYSDEVILFAEGYPWWMTEREKNLTKEELDSIIKKYMTELDILGDAEEQEIEYYS